jgi:uncharacterized protein (TIGR02569 family)
VAPPAAVLRKFGAANTPVPLAGGEGHTWRAGDMVVKRVHDEAEAAWCQELLAGLTLAGFRIPPPVAASDGRWVVDRWTACRYVDGLRDGRPRWPEILEAGARLHRALPAPDETARRVLGRREHRWAIADRVAWDAESAPLSPGAEALHQAITRRMVALDLEQQLVHGDLTGNVCFDEDGTPVVLDFSPYVRPLCYADAIVVADAMLWERAGPELFDLLTPGAVGIQVLLRALVFRLVAEDLGTAPRHHKELGPFRRVLTWLAL